VLHAVLVQQDEGDEFHDVAGDRGQRTTQMTGSRKAFSMRRSTSIWPPARWKDGVSSGCRPRRPACSQAKASAASILHFFQLRLGSRHRQLEGALFPKSSRGGNWHLSETPLDQVLASRLKPAPVRWSFKTATPLCEESIGTTDALYPLSAQVVKGLPPPLG
jgi:hypothetical protein